VAVFAEQQTEGNGKLKALYEAAAELSAAEKAELAKKLLSSPGLSIVFGNSQLSGNIIVQINSADRDVLANVLEAIAQRIATEGK
jgi:hypothetical protein